jgi:aspartyl-tRNA(Asn)/glutamyl-tRNA(Gln) amidotransferase subunit A
MNLHKLPAHKIHELLRSKKVSSKEVVEAFIDQIEKMEPYINAYITKTFDLAIQGARRVDERIARGEGIRSLEGIPIVVKDNICTDGIRTTCGSKILHNFIPPYDATVVKRLREAGALIIGKANMDEFAMGSSNETSFFGPVHNPWSLEKVPGGSSGGCCAAVAAGEAPVAIGSDTGGSIRQPASFCGVVGLKPTYGRVSRYGLVAFASSLDQIGPITRDIHDCAILMNILSGYDPMDSTSLDHPVPDYTSSLKEEISSIRIGVPNEYFPKGLDKGVKDVIDRAIKVLEEGGGRILEVSLPHTEYCVAAYYIIAPSEASSNLARYDGVQYGYRAEGELLDMYKRTRSEGFGDEVKRRIMLGTYALSSGYYEAYYLKALKVRSLIKRDFDEAFRICDIIITPTSPTPPFGLGEKVDDPLKMYLSDVFTISANLAGIPAISVPGGFSNGLPIGIQLLAPTLCEERLIHLGYILEKALCLKEEIPEYQ